MDAKILERLRPVDDSSTAIEASLQTAVHEHALAEQRHILASENRRAALGDVKAMPRDIAGFESQAATAQLDQERLEVVIPDLRRRLVAAQAAEEAAERKQAAEQARLAYVAALDALTASLPAYAEHAAAIAGICKLEKAKDLALAQFRAAVTRAAPVGSQYHGPADPGVPDRTPALAGHVVLPALQGRLGEVMIWGVIRPPAQPYVDRTTHIY